MRLQSKLTVKCLLPGQGEISGNSIRGFRGASEVKSLFFRRRRRRKREMREGRERRGLVWPLAETVLFSSLPAPA